jgi:hypothetical protein
VEVIEEASGFPRLGSLLLIGFVVHSLLPRRFRGICFLLLSISAFWIILGDKTVLLVGTGLLLIGLCHLPIGMRWRVFLICSVAAVLVAMQADRLPWSTTGQWSLVLPVLGSMFMFRLIVYMYDIRHQTRPSTIVERLSYFFLLPNVCFLLFPIVDYQTYLRTHYDRAPNEIYQKGLLWIFRGITHLLLYRWIYLYLAPNPVELVGVLDVAQYIVTLWVLYLRVSGLFHISIGILCLFGFNLPATNHLYFLASGPNDLWRRANIYWKDFMMKVFYYPTFMSIKKKLGMTQALVYSTVVVFIVTWFLHSFQWFWLLGTFPLRFSDMVFWSILGGLLLANSLWELRRGRKRTLLQRETSWSIQRSVIHALKVVGVFSFISILWSWWSAANTKQWWSMLSVVGESNLGSFIGLGLILAGIIVIGIIGSYLRHRGMKLSLESEAAHGRPAAVLVTLGSVVLLSLGSPRVHGHFNQGTAGFIVSMQGDRLNSRDAELQQRGYYESVLESTSSLAQKQPSQRKPKTKQWRQTRQSNVVRKTHDSPSYELIPSLNSTYKGAPFRTNRWGMRDRPYSMEKPVGTLRIAALGVSIEMGAGVREKDIYLALLEDQLNAENRIEGIDRIEILNFGVGGYGIYDHLQVLEKKVLQFNPDALLFTGHTREHKRSMLNLGHLYRARRNLVPDEILRIMEQAGVTDAADEYKIQWLLTQGDFSDRIQLWGYRQILEICRQNKIHPLWVFIPRAEGEEREDIEILKAQASEVGFAVLSAEGAYENWSTGDLTIAPWDNHPNEKGNRLLADKILPDLRKELQNIDWSERLPTTR